MKINMRRIIKENNWGERNAKDRHCFLIYDHIDIIHQKKLLFYSAEVWV